MGRGSLGEGAAPLEQGITKKYLCKDRGNDTWAAPPVMAHGLRVQA